jgi:uncharacterized protein YjiS (DUF1127 family)
MGALTFTAVYRPDFEMRSRLNAWLAKCAAWRLQRLTIRLLRSLDARLLDDVNVDAEALFGSHPMARRRPPPEPAFRFDFSGTSLELPACGADCAGMAGIETAIKLGKA